MPERNGLRSTCSAIDQAIGALKAELNRGVPAAREGAIREEIGALRQQKRILGCDQGPDFTDLAIAAPSDEVIRETTDLMDQVADRIEESKDAEAVLQVASEVLERAAKLRNT